MVNVYELCKRCGGTIYTNNPSAHACIAEDPDPVATNDEAIPPGIKQAPPQWFAHPPTEPGLYWFALLKSGDRHPPRFCLVVELDGKLVLGHSGYDDAGYQDVTVMHRVWAGPLLFPTGEATHRGQDG